MKSKLSAVLDNEATGEDVSALCEALRHSKELRDDLVTYTLIGNCLRGDAASFVDLTPSVMAALDREPSILVRSPRHRPMLKTVGGLALAASAAGILITGSIFFFTRQTTLVDDVRVATNRAMMPEPAKPLVVASTSGASIGTELRETDIREYLIAHQTHSRGVSLGADSSQQIRTVSLMDEGSAK